MRWGLKMQVAQTTVPIDNYPGLARDMKSHGVISTDKSGLQLARAQKVSVLTLRQGLEETQAEVRTLKTTVAELKTIVESIKKRNT